MPMGLCSVLLCYELRAYELLCTIRDLVLGRACLSQVKVVLRHVLGRIDLHISVLEYKLVT